MQLSDHSLYFVLVTQRMRLKETLQEFIFKRAYKSRRYHTVRIFICPIQIHNIIYSDPWAINVENLEMFESQMLGKGAFCEVYKGALKGNILISDNSAY